MLITFSGLDGSGKTTLINRLKLWLEHGGCKVEVRSMYYDISFYAHLRGLRNGARGFFRTNMKGLKVSTDARNNTVVATQVNPHDPKVDVSDKVGRLKRSFYRVVRCQFARRIALFFDLFFLLMWRSYIEIIRGRILIIDRYMYDYIVDVVNKRKNKSLFADIFLRVVPRPKLPIFVDVQPEVAFARKGEYSVDYMSWRRNAYMDIFKKAGNALILRNSNLDDATERLKAAFIHRTGGCLRAVRP